MTPGAVGCFLSHRRCWEECVRSGEALLIFEDDVVLAPNFRNIVAADPMQRTRCS
jgi:GR25 family glycosyltransferase involved in LPS biosynthesis